MLLSDPRSRRRSVYNVGGVSLREVWAVGIWRGRAFILRWNGTAWSSVQIPQSRGQTSILWALHARRRNDVWAVGRRTRFQGEEVPLVLHWNGRKWKVVRVPLKALLTRCVLRRQGAHGLGRVGSRLQAARGSSAKRSLSYWNALSWSFSAIPTRRYADDVLYGVDAVPGGRAWAVGSRSIYDRAPFRLTAT